MKAWRAITPLRAAGGEKYTFRPETKKFCLAG
jgi:hypothetical protein